MRLTTGAGAQADAVGLACVSGVLALARGVEIFLRNLSNYLRARPLENEASVI